MYRVPITPQVGSFNAFDHCVNCRTWHPSGRRLMTTRSFGSSCVCHRARAMSAARLNLPFAVPGPIQRRPTGKPFEVDRASENRRRSSGIRMPRCSDRER